MNCSSCKTKLERCVAGISVKSCGNETIFNYYLCESCDRYTVETYFDSFMDEGPGMTRVETKLRAEGDADVRDIGRCPKPDDPWCHCPVHLRFGA